MTASVTAINEFVFGHMAGTEAALQADIERWFTKISLPFQAQASTCSGVADFTLSYQQGLRDPWCILEVKRGLHPQKTSVSDLAGYFEQCVKYQRSTGLPVFLGPFFVPTMGLCDYFSGGPSQRSSTAAFSAIAGRVNVGLFFIQCASGQESHPSLWGGFILTMRNKPVARYHVGGQNTLWPNGSVDLVSFDKAPSASVRVAS